MDFLRIIASVIFILLGILVFYKGIRTTRFGTGIIDIIAGIGFIIIGLLIWFRYIS